MKNTIKKMGLLGLGAAVIMAAAVGCKCDEAKGCMTEMSGKIVKKITKKLDLNEAQQAKLKVIEATIVEKAEQCNKSKGDHVSDFAALVKADKFDDAAVKAKCDDKQKKMRKVCDNVIKEFSEFHAMLSAEQKDKLAEIIKDKGGHCPLK